MSTSGHAAWLSAGTFLSCVALLLFCGGFFRLELTNKDQQTELADLKAQLSALAFQQDSLRIEFVLRRHDYRKAQMALQESLQRTSVAVELKVKKHETRMDELEAQLSRQSSVHKSIVTAEPDADSEQELNRNNMRTAQGRSRRAVRIGIMAPVGHCGQKGQKGEPGPQGIPGVKGEPGESIQVPTVAVSPKSLTVNESEVASMQCSASGNPVPTVVWSKVNGSLPAVRSEVFAGGKLEIRSSEGNDSGVYQCEASNILGTSRGQVKLNVNTAPRISLRPGPTYARVRRSVELPMCHVTGHPPPVVTWKRASRPTLSDRAIAVVSRGNGLLIMRSPRMSDTDNYTCEASNLLGSRSATTLLVVVELPQFSQRPPRHATYAPGETLRLRCGATGDPRPVITWRKGYEQLPAGRSVVSNGQLTIQNVTTQDAGQYVCTATSAGVSSVWAGTSVRISSRLAVHLTYGHYGRLEVYVSGAWGTVCDDVFDENLNAANVVCRQLGYSGALKVHSSAYYGQGSGRVWLDQVRSTGSESSIFDCRHAPYGVGDCGHDEDVGMSCST